MDPLVNPDAPLPELHRQPHRVVAQNSWQQLVATAPLNSERVRYNTTSPTPLPGASRSTFRNGSLQFTEQGIQIEGMAVVPNLRLVQATGTIHLCFIFVYAVFAFGSILISGMRHFGSVGAVFLWTGIALRAVVAFALERRRTPATQFVPWTDVAGAQIDRGGKWITLIYRTSVQQVVTKRLFHTEITQTPGTCFLSLNKLDEATVKGVAETMRHFAPEVLFAEVEAYEWTRGRMIAVGVLSIPVILLFIGLCVLFWKILFP